MRHLIIQDNLHITRFINNHIVKVNLPYKVTCSRVLWLGCGFLGDHYSVYKGLYTKVRNVASNFTRRARAVEVLQSSRISYRIYADIWARQWTYARACACPYAHVCVFFIFLFLSFYINLTVIPFVTIWSSSDLQCWKRSLHVLRLPVIRAIYRNENNELEGKWDKKAHILLLFSLSGIQTCEEFLQTYWEKLLKDEHTYIQFWSLCWYCGTAICTLDWDDIIVLPQKINLYLI